MNLLAQTEAPLMTHGTVGEAVDFFIHFFKTPAGTVCIVLAGGLLALRIYYAARQAVSVRADARLGPPRGFLASYFAKARLEQLKKQQRWEEAADLLAAWQPGRGVEVVELLIKGKKYARAAAILVAHKRLRTAADTYVRAGSWDLAAEHFARGEENYLRAGNKLAAARLCARAGQAEKAARYYAEAERPREAAEQLEKAGKTREAVEQYVEALALVEKAGSLEAASHPREKLLSGGRVRDELCDKILSLYQKLGDADAQVE